MGSWMEKKEEEEQTKTCLVQAKFEHCLSIGQAWTEVSLGPANAFGWSKKLNNIMREPCSTVVHCIIVTGFTL